MKKYVLPQSRRAGLLAAVAIFHLAGALAAEPPLPPPFYHPDATHLWNRLHNALHLRLGPDRRWYGYDRIEPLIWFQSDFLIEPVSNGRAVKVLDEFISTRGEQLIDDPLKRAVLQRDLWLIFNSLHERQSSALVRNLPAEAGESGAAAHKLAKPLAKAIARLALPSEAIARLPDN